MSQLIDTSTPFGARAERRLREEVIAWLVTVSRSGTPLPVPVWFLWEGAARPAHRRACSCR